MKQPRLTFACELGPDALTALFADDAVIHELVTLDADVALGLLDLSPARADVVRRLNEAGVPVTAWLLLPEDQGYWFNVDNHAAAAARYAEVKVWTQENNLHWAGVGLDIEPDIGEIKKLLSDDRLSLLPMFCRRAFDHDRVLFARLAYGALVREIRADGYGVESYQFPLIADERRAGSTVLQRLFGILDVPADREGLMLYSSFIRPYGPGILCSYAPDADMIGVGVTGGGVELNGPEPLSWEEFARDLRLARRWSDDIFIFSLEGCVAQDFLSRLRAFDWERPLLMPTDQIEQVNRIRQAGRGALWAGEHPFVVLASVLALLLVLLGMKRRSNQ